MDWIIHQLRVHPELAIFLTLFVGFWIGKIKIGKFSLGVVTSVLLVGVLVGQLNITVDGPIKSVFPGTEKGRTPPNGICCHHVCILSGYSLDIG